jgi:hypothetical protein
MSTTGKNTSTEYVSLLEIVHKPYLPSVDNWQATAFWFCASLALFSVLSTLCPLPEAPALYKTEDGLNETFEIGRAEDHGIWSKLQQSSFLNGVIGPEMLEFSSEPLELKRREPDDEVVSSYDRALNLPKIILVGVDKFLGRSDHLQKCLPLRICHFNVILRDQFTSVTVPP